MLHSNPFNILNEVPTGIFILNNDFTIAFWNKCMTQWSQLSTKKVLGKKIQTIYPELSKKKHALRIQNVFNGGPPVLLSAQLHGDIFPCKKSNGHHRIFNTRIKSLRANASDLKTSTVHDPWDPAAEIGLTSLKNISHWNIEPHPGKPLQAIFTLEDVTDLSERIQTYYIIKKELSIEIERKNEVENELLASKQLLLNVYNNTASALVVFDQENTIISCNAVNEKIFGYTQDELMGQNGALFFSPCDKNFPFFDAIRKEITLSNHYEGELCMKTGFDTEIICKIKGSPLHENNPNEIICCFDDITREKKAQRILKKQATIDPLTGTVNRRHFMEQMEKEMRTLSRHGYPICFALCDLDHFKIVNDTYGHAMGDEVLIYFTEMLRTELRETDIVGRYGGDEFIFLMPHTDINEALTPLERIRKNMARHRFFVPSDRSFCVTVTMGVTQISTPPKSNTTAIKEALQSLFVKTDQALYKAKERGRNCISTA